MKRKKAFDPNEAPPGHTVGWIWSTSELKFKRTILKIGDPGVRTRETDALLALKVDSMEKSARSMERELLAQGKRVDINCMTGEIVSVANDYKPGVNPRAKLPAKKRQTKFVGWTRPGSHGTDKIAEDPDAVYKPIGAGLVRVDSPRIWEHLTSGNMTLVDPDQTLQNTSRALVEMARGWHKGKCPTTWNLTRDLLEQIEADEILQN